MLHARIESALRHERGVAIAAVVVIAALAWAQVALMVADPAALAQPLAALARDLAWLCASDPGRVAGAVAQPAPPAWSAAGLVATTAMWTAMMVAMMLPVAAPMIAAFAEISGKLLRGRRLAARTALFVLGYLAVWGLWSAAAALAQTGLAAAALLTPDLKAATPYVGGALLLVAGAYQWTPMKQACLTYCRTPMTFFLTSWRPGDRGALAMGLAHGVHCVGCCWAIMALMFFFGAMNVAWMALLALATLGEKLLPAGDRLGRATGAGLALWGAWLILGGLLA